MFSALACGETPQASNNAERSESLLMSAPFCVREYFWRGLLRCGFSSPCGKNSLARLLFHGSSACPFRSAQALPGHRQIHQRERRAARHAVGIAEHVACAYRRTSLACASLTKFCTSSTTRNRSFCSFLATL